MEPRVKSRSALVVSGTEKGQEAVRKLLDGTAFTDVTVSKSGGGARRLALSEQFDCVIVNAPLPDEFGHELACHMAESGMGTILLVKNELLDEVSAAVEANGVLTLAKPISQALFSQALKLIVAMWNRFHKVEAENKKLQTKVEEIRVISRAKLILMEYLRMSEEQAHKYIERQAMDLRETKKKVAEGILKTYDN